jgi:hypothetical protein
MVTGIEDIIKGIKALNLSGAEIQAAIKPSGDRIINYIHSNIPVKTGRLKQSYGYVKRKRSNGLTIGAKYGKGGANHAHLIELGFTLRNGVKVPGKLIEQKAYEANKTSALESMAKNLGNIIEDKWNK